ncbi:MAG: hypothetical protein OER86_06060, partial [Phycisphaerae bacterium]|nr:hypothetical protein [Phycisphaerae bacterium]
AEVPVNAVAMMMGGAGLGKPSRLYLRDGQVLVGTVDAGAVKFQTESGIEVKLRPSELQVYLAPSSEADRKPHPQAIAYLGTHWGDRLALLPGSKDPLAMTCPFGALRVPLGRIESLVYQREPTPRHALRLADATQLRVFVDSGVHRVHSALLGPLEIPARDLLFLASVNEVRKAGAEAETEARSQTEPILRPHCQLVEDQVVIGQIDISASRLVAPGDAAKIDMTSVRQVLRRKPVAESQPGERTAFRVVLPASTLLKAYWERSVIPVATDYGLLHIPHNSLTSARLSADQPAETSGDGANKVPKEDS